MASLILSFFSNITTFGCSVFLFVCFLLLYFLTFSKANHIASEQKRRQAIREGFDKITAIVPDLEKSQGRSEATVLTESK
jgi:hypothetical protein